MPGPEGDQKRIDDFKLHLQNIDIPVPDTAHATIETEPDRTILEPEACPVIEFHPNEMETVRLRRPTGALIVEREVLTPMGIGTPATNIINKHTFSRTTMAGKGQIRQEDI